MVAIGEKRHTDDEEEEKKSQPLPKPPLPWKTRLFLSASSFVTDVSRRSDGTLNRRLVSLLDRPTSATPTPTRGVSSSDVVLDSSRDLWVRIYLPATVTDLLPIVVFFHGGGFAFLSPASVHYNTACRRFCRKLPAAIVSVNYRLSPEHKCPAQYDDGLDVLRHLGSPNPNPNFENLLRVSDLSRTYLAGDSAGANIAHHVARRWAENPNPNPNPKLTGVIAIQPFFGGEGRVGSEERLRNAPLVNVERTDWLWRAFLPEGESRDHAAANVLAGTGMEEIRRMERFPKVMVVVGGYDPLQDWQRRYADGMRERGRKEVVVVEYPEAIHAFYLFPELPEAHLVVDEMRRFVHGC